MALWWLEPGWNAREIWLAVAKAVMDAMNQARKAKTCETCESSRH